MLKNKVSIYVPSTYRDQPAPDNVVKFYVNNTLKELSKMYGGATATDAIGSYYSKDLDKLITEPVTICYSYCDSYDLEKLRAICEELKTVFIQESISLEINNTLEFI